MAGETPGRPAESVPTGPKPIKEQLGELKTRLEKIAPAKMTEAIRKLKTDIEEILRNPDLDNPEKADVRAAAETLMRTADALLPRPAAEGSKDKVTEVTDKISDIIKKFQDMMGGQGSETIKQLADFLKDSPFFANLLRTVAEGPKARLTFVQKVLQENGRTLTLAKDTETAKKQAEEGNIRQLGTLVTQAVGLRKQRAAVAAKKGPAEKTKADTALAEVDHPNQSFEKYLRVTLPKLGAGGAVELPQVLTLIQTEITAENAELTRLGTVADAAPATPPPAATTPPSTTTSPR